MCNYPQDKNNYKENRGCGFYKKGNENIIVG